MRILPLTALALAVFAGRAHAQCTPAQQKLINDERYDDLRAELTATIKKNPADDVSMHCMGSMFAAMDKLGDAIDWFEKSVKANDKVSFHHLWLGNALGDQAQHTNKLKLPFLARRVKSEFEKAVELDPTSVDARLGLIEFYAQAPGVMGGSMDKAKDQARAIEKLNPVRGHIAMARLLEKDKDVAGADREFTAALAASPDSNSAYTNLASFYRRQKRYADAVAVYDRLLAAKPDAINARLNIAATLVQSGQDLDRAEREVKLWQANPPKDAPTFNMAAAHYVLGSVYDHQAKKDAARTEYQAALAINPKYEDAKKALAALK